MITSLRKILFKKILIHHPDVESQKVWIKENPCSTYRNLAIIHKRSIQTPVRGVVILCHPFRAEAKDFFLQNGHAELYLNAGFHVITFDFNGFGESPLDNHDFDLDVLTVVKFAKAIYPKQKISAHGISFGAAQLLRSISHPNHGIDNAIVENCLTKYYHYFKNRKPLVYVLIRVISPFFKRMNMDNNYIDKISSVQDLNDVLLIYGKKDELTTLAMGQQLQAACNVNCELIVYDCGHMKAIETDFEDYKTLLVDYIES